MTRYILRRVLSAVLTVWIVMTLTFVMMKAIPGDPFTSEKNLPEAVVLNLRTRYHLNDPLWKQYADYCKNVVTWNLGPSFRYATRSVNDIINQSFPISAQLGGMALAVSLLAGLPMGVLSALKRDRWPDHLVTFVTTLGISQPSFIVGTVLQYWLAVKLKLLPTALWEGGISHAVMPVIALSFFPAAFFARLVRSSMLEVVSQDFMRTAKAKGLSRLTQIVKHALRNALLPLITVLGPQTAAILTGSMVVERIFAIPGLGGEFVTSIFNRDYTVIMGVTVFYAVLIVFFNLVVDILYSLVDPRIKIAD
ncbi:MAG TPA: ABC transporter permease [Symbiobacteriaceae bacterium]|nr:ABC transporter permease [Symbiobacteriaceae bacterium]